MNKDYFKIKIQEGVPIFSEKELFLETCNTHENGTYYLSLQKNAPESEQTRIQMNTVRGDMRMLSKCMDGNKSPEELYIQTKRFFKDDFVYTVKDLKTGEKLEMLRSLTEFDRAYIIKFIEDYRMIWEDLFHFGLPDRKIKPLSHFFPNAVIIWYDKHNIMGASKDEKSNTKNKGNETEKNN